MLTVNKTSIIAENIRTAATAKGMTMEDLAKAAGYEPETMRKYFEGRTSPRAYMLYRIAKALGHSMEWFMMDVDDGAGMRPHGRLIDADALEAVIREVFEIGRRTQEAENSKEYAGYLMAFNSFLVEVQTAQTVMEAEK